MSVTFRCLWLAPVAALACGDPAPPTEFKGEPLVTIDCVVTAEGAAPMRVALLWQTPDGYAPNADDTTTVVSFPANAVIEVFTPPDATLLQAHDGASGPLAVGEIVAFEDLDGDHRWSADEPIVGISDHLVVFAPEDVFGTATGALTAGFHERTAVSCLVDPEARLDAASACIVQVNPKFSERFVYDCPPIEDEPCYELGPIRRGCHVDPSAAICGECAAGIFPADATPDECYAWYDACAAALPFADCGSEMKVCTSGEDPGADPEDCTGQCACDFRYDECIAAGIDEAACATKRANCTP